MKLGVVTTSYPRFAGDPAGNFVAGHVAALRALGHSVEVVAAGERVDDDRGASERVARVPSRLFYQGGAPDRLERSLLANAPDALAFSLRLAREVRRRARDWDAIVAHWLIPSAIAALPARKPLLAIVHGGDLHTLRRLHLLRPALRLLRRAELVFVSAELRALAAREVPALADAIVQPMGIDAAAFKTIVRAPSDPPIVLVVARLVPIKGVDIAIAAMRDVPRARLVVLGDGPERDRLRALAPTATFTGEVSTSERDAWLARASVVVIPSRVLPNGRGEGLPTIALEALASGVPVVASAIGGLATLGIATVPPESPTLLAHAIDQMLSQPTDAGSLRALAAAFDWSRIAVRLIVARTSHRAA